jgi:hypothetical protein
MERTPPQWLLVTRNEGVRGSNPRGGSLGP